MMRRIRSKVCSVLLFSLIFSLFAPVSNAVQSKNIFTYSVCSGDSQKSEFAICIPDEDEVHISLSENEISQKYKHYISKDSAVIIEPTQETINLKSLSVGDYVYYKIIESVWNASKSRDKVHFSIIGNLVVNGSSDPNRRIDHEFRQSYVITYSDQSLTPDLTRLYGLDQTSVKSSAPLAGGTWPLHETLTGSKILLLDLTDVEYQKISLDTRILGIGKNFLVLRSALQSNPPWNLDRLDQENLPLNSSFTYAKELTTPIVYVLDTGINTSHNEFTSRVLECWYFLALTESCTDYDGHGTHVAGTAIGSTFGVAKNSKTIAVKISTDGGASNSYYIASAIYAVRVHHSIYRSEYPAVLNLSFGSSLPSQTSNADRALFQDLINAKIVPVVAAGNSAQNACNWSYGDLGSSSVNLAIVVGATWINGNKDQYSWYSNHGPCVTIFAPGGAANGNYLNDIKSAGISGSSSVAYMSGTSMASPLVAGVVANYLSLFPASNYSQVKSWLLANSRSKKIQSLPTSTINKMVSIHNLLSQTINFNPPTTLNSTQFPYALTASTTATGLTPSVSSSTPSVCTVSDLTLTWVNAGRCTLTASQSGNDTYAAAKAVAKTITLSKQSQTITFNPPTTLNSTQIPYILDNPVSSSGLPVTITSRTTKICTVSSRTLNLVTPGRCILIASQSGDAIYAAARDITKTIILIQS
jgi:hypothetical protein